MNKPKVFNGVTFYPAAFDKSEAEFLEHEKHTGLSEAQLKEVYGLHSNPVLARGTNDEAPTKQPVKNDNSGPKEKPAKP
jgi:hypothetical protein